MFSFLGRNEQVWVASPGSGLDKRQCTLQVCFTPENNQVRTEIIFRGQGKVKAEEKKAYHKSVDVFWQKNAWADTTFSCEWVEKTLKPAVPDGEEFLLICDNLNAQTSDAFKKSVHDINGLVWFGLPGATDKWQPVDAGYGFTLKHLIKKVQDEWLDLEDENGQPNIDLWADSKGLSASHRRILFTEWVGKASDMLNHSNYDNFRWNCFEKTGMLMTADGSDDDKIRPEGPEIDPPESAPEPLDQVVEDELFPPIMTEEIPDSVTDDEDDELENIDHESDRVFDDSLVGKNIRGLYETGWHTGKIEYFNTQLEEYKVSFDDGSTDFLKKEDIDGVEIILIEEQESCSTRSGRPRKNVDYKRMAMG